MIRKIFFALFIFCGVCSYVQSHNLLPKPQRLFYYNDTITSSDIVVDMVDNIPGVEVNHEEAYYLKVSTDGIIIKALTETGVYRARQTLEQLAIRNGKKTMYPACEITDWPAFRIRGFMQDVGRTYISMDELKKEIDLLGKFKMNVFHWHLTENQAWRLESKIFPKLNAKRNMTRMPGKYYTLEDARGLVEYCKERHITLIPEIDMPGHSAAFVRAFNTDMQSEKGMEILKKLMDEVCETFDVPYIHIGTDEVQFTNPDFVPKMVSHIRSKGKKVISWNPGWNYKPGEIDMTQLWSYRGKAQDGIPAIDCRFHYINHFDIYADVVALYNSKIYNRDHGDENIAGSIMAVWNDRFVEDERQILADNNFYASMLAFAERSWTGGGHCYFNGKGTLLWPENTLMNSDFEDFENRMLWHKRNTLKGEPFPYVKQSNVKWRITDAFPNGGDLTMSFPPENEDGNTFNHEGKIYGTRTINGAGVYLRHVWGTLLPGFYDKPQEDHTAYAYTWVHSPKKQKAGLNIDFQNYSRSESDLPPLQGAWDYKGSRIWLNGEEVLPPQWKSCHKERNNEIPMTNENSSSRKPNIVTLNEGWNKILLKLPVGKFQSKEVRLVKWMFNVVLVSPDGKEELEGITYSTENPNVASSSLKEKNYSTYYYQRATLFESLGTTPDDILFVGNSITDGGEWPELFSNPKVKNRGISGDTTQGLYDRLPSLLDGKPKKIFLLIGVNNIPHGDTPGDIASGIEKIVKRIKKESPSTKVYVQSILPVNPDMKMFGGHTSKWKMVPRINNAIMKVADREDVEYIDLYRHFVDGDGKMDARYTNDGLHLLGEGYLLWRDIVEPYINE